MHGLTMQYGECVIPMQFLNYVEVSVFLVNILKRFQPHSLTNVVSGGRCVRYALIGGAQGETDQK
jgi:hypothetical protein